MSLGERSSAYIVIGSGWCEVIVRFRLGACELAKECVAGSMESETETFGIECVSIFFLSQ